MHYKYLIFIIIFFLQTQVLFADWSRTRASIMGTEIAVEIWHAEQENADLAVAAVISELHRIDALMSSYRPDSELSLVNAGAANAPVTVSEELYRLIEQSLYFSDLTSGAFDITYASAGKYYDYRNGIRPTAAQLEQALPAID